MIILSILEETFESAAKQVLNGQKYAKKAQIDVVDGKLVEGKTFLDIEKLATIKTPMILEIHLMVSDPMNYLNSKIEGVQSICTQIESMDDLTPFINRSKELGYKVGISVGPDTNYEQLDSYIDKIDFVQFMTIYPGAQGKTWLPEVLFKIQKFHEKFPHIRLQADGGIKKSNILQLQNSGISDFVVGSEILKDSNPAQKYVELENMTNSNDKISTLKDKKIKQIAFLGGAAWLESDEAYKQAYDVSKVLAEAGYEIVNGGGPGVMRASTKGGHAGGGRVLAITYHPNKPKRHYEGVDTENDFDDEIVTLDYFDRTKVMLQTTQIHIVFKGSLGTLSEFGMTWISSWIHEPNNKPIILYGEFWNGFLKFIDDYLLISGAERDIVQVCTTPEQVLEVVRKFDS